jgi:hypothetical protein
MEINAQIMELEKEKKTVRSHTILHKARCIRHSVHFVAFEMRSRKHAISHLMRSAGAGGLAVEGTGVGGHGSTVTCAFLPLRLQHVHGNNRDSFEFHSGVRRNNALGKKPL